MTAIDTTTNLEQAVEVQSRRDVPCGCYANQCGKPARWVALMPCGCIIPTCEPCRQMTVLMGPGPLTCHFCEATVEAADVILEPIR